MASHTDFGYSGFVPDPPSTDEVVIASATKWLQHRVVLQVRKEHAASAASFDELAAAVSNSPGNLRKKMNGTVNLGLEDIVALTTLFGPSIFPQVETLEDLFAPSYRNHLTWTNINGLGSFSVDGA
ncbi:MAG: hypothetical protein ACE37B_11820 [Ilumatobacter sp.]|uniref:hypothetical protein n=1 Tax=Ilumatobacter sp. TaxID=1967498 RepID=UPI00391D8A80